MVVTEKSWHVMTIFADAIKAIFLQVDFFLCYDALRTSTLKGSDHDNFLLIIVLLPKTTKLKKSKKKKINKISCESFCKVSISATSFNFLFC